MTFLYAAYTVIWVMLFAYMFNVNKKQDTILKEIEELKEKIKK